jgi:phosphatidate cytidylyltransferase
LLRTRVITAVILLLVLVGMLFFASAAVWALFVLAVTLAACWEWSRMATLSPRAQAIYLFVSGAAGACFWLLYVRGDEHVFMSAALTAFILAAIFWILIAPLWLAKLATPAPYVRAVAGWLVMWPTWFAFVVLRDAGPWVLLAFAAVVWVSDIAAYFAGKAFGRRKLAPAISPGKTWEGVYGALVGVAIYAGVLAYAAPLWDIGAAVVTFGSTPLAIVAFMVLAALGIVGDLFESWMKRGAGLKDSSSLLPGHGGILDRIDALTSTLPIATLVVLLRAGAL